MFDVTNKLTELPDEPPEILEGDERLVYLRMLPRFKECGCRACDINTVISFCDVVAEKEEAKRELAKPVSEGGGKVIWLVNEKNGQKYSQISSWVGIKNRAIELEKKLVQDLGLAPAVRRRLKQDIDDPDGEGRNVDPNQLRMF